jgi:hypothetical protein
MANRPTVTLTLTPEQREQIEKTTGQQLATLKLEALDARIAPGVFLN